ncbi:UNVERIFIED_CONTAM: hypothetical protein FKN15_057970 [Acipenser sinensis]
MKMLQNDRCCDSWSLSSWPVIERVYLIISSPGLKLLAVSTQDDEPQYAVLVQPPTCRLHEGAALLTNVFFSVIFFIAFIQACNSTAKSLHIQCPINSY